jgi:drug/metabolite transporter (DMT)-like permease
MRPGGLTGTTKEGVDPLEMSCFRSMFNCITIYLLMKFKYEKSVILEVPKELYKPMVIRSLAGTTAFISMTYGVSYLPITIFETLFYTMPFFISIMSYYILKEQFSKVEHGAMVLCFIGVVILLQTKHDEENELTWTKNYLAGAILTLYFSLANSLVVVLTRYMKEIHFSVI